MPRKTSIFNAMEDRIDVYRRKLSLSKAEFIPINHEDAMVADVFKIKEASCPDRILKICSRKGDFLREAYFLRHFFGKIAVPRIIQLIEPEKGVDGAILMECIQGELLKSEVITKALALEIGSVLGYIHLERAQGYGDVTDPSGLTDDPRIPFTNKFEEGLAECKGHLSESLINACRRHFDKNIDLLLHSDGPCLIHRDFRPGNILVSKGKVRGVIDWSSGRAGFAEEDFCFMEGSDWPKDYKKFFLEGYASIRKVPDYKPMIPLLLLSQAISVIGITVKKGTWDSKNAKLYRIKRQYLDSLENEK